MLPPMKKLSDLVGRVRAFLLDCDGVLWNGAEPIPGAVEAVQKLHASGRGIFYVTNNSSKSRGTYARRLDALGLPADPSTIYGSAYLAAQLLKGQVEGAYVIGGPGLAEELERVGISVLGGPDEPVRPDDPIDQEVFAAWPLDPRVGAVVVGWDISFHYAKLARAAKYVQANPRCRLVATNRDASIRAGDWLMPGGGTMVAALETALGRTAELAGKPAGHVIDLIVAEHGLDPRGLCMVGDRLDTDIEMAYRRGIPSVLLLTGVTDKARALQAIKSPPSPSLVAPSIVELALALDAR